MHNVFLEDNKMVCTMKVSEVWGGGRGGGGAGEGPSLQGVWEVTCLLRLCLDL